MELVEILNNPIMAASAALFLVGIPGNILVAVICSYILKFDVPTTVFLFNVSLGNIIYLLSFPVVLYKMVAGQWVFGNALCKIYCTTIQIGLDGSIAFLTGMSVDRCLATCYPIKSMRYRSNCILVAFSCLLIWSWVALTKIPSAWFSESVHFWPRVNGSILFNATPTIQCLVMPMPEVRQLFTVYSMMTSYLLPVLIIVISHSLIVQSLWVRKTSLAHHTKKQKQVCKVVILLSCFFIVCYTPHWIVMLMSELNHQYFNYRRRTSLLFAFLTYLLQFMHTALNSYASLLVSSTYRKQLGTFICLRGAKKPTQV